MEKELTIKIKINTNFQIQVYPNIEDWVGANNDEKIEYVKEKLKEHIIENTDNIIYELLDNIEIEYN